MSNLQVRIPEQVKKDIHHYAIDEGVSIPEAVKKLVISGFKYENIINESNPDNKTEA